MAEEAPRVKLSPAMLEVIKFLARGGVVTFDSTYMLDCKMPSGSIPGERLRYPACRLTWATIDALERRHLVQIVRNPGSIAVRSGGVGFRSNGGRVTITPDGASECSRAVA